MAGPMTGMLDEQALAQLDELLKEEAANPTPEGEPDMEETEVSADEAEEVNENTDAIGEGDGEAADIEVVPNPEAEANPQAPAAALLPDGFESVEQLTAAYNALMEQDRRRGDEMQAYREMNEQLAAIAEALGYTKDIGSVDLDGYEQLRESNPEEYARGQMRREIADQLKPMLEQQQKHLKGRMIDQAWKAFAGEHEDVAELMDEIRAEIEASPMLADSENGLEAAYHIARSKRYKPEKALFEEDAFIARAAENPKIREKVIADYLKKVSKDGEGAPASVGGSGSAVATGRKKISSMEEARRGLDKLLGIG